MPRIISIPTGAKNSTPLECIDEFDLERCDFQLSIEINFKIKYTYSLILEHIGAGFARFYKDKTFPLLSKEQFKAILRSENLNILSEDHAFEALCLWIKANPEGLDSVQELFELIRWNYVTINTLLVNMREMESLRKHKEFRRIFKTELKR